MLRAQNVIFPALGHTWSHCRLTVVFFPQCEEQICQSLALAQALANDVDMHVVVFRDFGKAKVKKCRVNPDAFIQIALQLAYYRVIPPPQQNKLSIYSVCGCMFKKTSRCKRKSFFVVLISFTSIFFFNLLIAGPEKIQYDLRIRNDASVQGGQD